MEMIHVKKFHIDGIPVSIYELENDAIKPVIFSFHGFTGYKDGDYFKREDELARRGFIVVGLDTILHGERRINLYETLSESTKWKDFNHFIIQSAKDAVEIYEKYIKFMPRVKPNALYSMGVSMGGAISIYLSTIYPLKRAVSIVGTPSMVEFYKYLKDKLNWEEDNYYFKNLVYLEKYDPVINQSKINGKLFLTGGASDDVIPVKFVTMLENHPQVTTKVYQTAHMPNQQQFDEAYEFLLEEEKKHE
ncbi:alpha/beta hydrolase family protein [Acholeplasma hippikon]|uniref:Esterase n=1 Tax=Acholeplasma hippikon TaxID=264636 RepID=A0A449BIQ9_9MOLU|nr:dienelactone hydrolase family protein [Acholeplasma hippikon]VEU82207.1 esterase [Acholeplasma hippikon]